jgi:hypothetical protein
VGRVPFILAEQEANDLVVPLLCETLVLKAVSVTDVVVAVEETADVTRELVQGDAVIHSACVLVGQSATESVGGISCPIGTGPFSAGGPDIPEGGGTAKTRSVRRVSNTRVISCKGIWEESKDVLRSWLWSKPDRPLFYTNA